MKFYKKQIRDKIDELLEDGRFEDACFLILDGLSFLDGEDLKFYDFDDEDFCQIMMD